MVLLLFNSFTELTIDEIGRHLSLPKEELKQQLRPLVTGQYKVYYFEKYLRVRYLFFLVNECSCFSKTLLTVLVFYTSFASTCSLHPQNGWSRFRWLRTKVFLLFVCIPLHTLSFAILFQSAMMTVLQLCHLWPRCMLFFHWVFFVEPSAGPPP